MAWSGLRLPAHVDITLDDEAGGVTVTHIVRIGYEGFARLLDPLLAIGHGAAFAKALDEHVRTEFPRLQELLHPFAGAD